MRLKTRTLVANFAYAVLLKCAESITKANDIDVETAMSLIPMVKPQIHWTVRDTKRVINEVLDGRRNGDDYYRRSKEAVWMLRFFNKCIKQINRYYTRLIDCSCIEEKLKKSFGFSALDLHYIKKLLSASSGEIA